MMRRTKGWTTMRRETVGRSGGPAVAEFEEASARYLGVRHAVTTSSGTTALHLALASLGIGPGDEVVVPDFTMVSPVSAVLPPNL